MTIHLKPWGWPLRVSLVAVTLVLVACGLLASGVAVTTILSHRMFGRVDSALVEASRTWAQEPWRRDPSFEYGFGPARPPSKYYVLRVENDNRILTAINDRDAAPALPPGNDVGRNPVTLPSINGSDIRWRAVSLRRPNGELTTVAVDLYEVENIIRSLVWLQAGIGVAVLVVVGLAGFGMVKRSLKPLTEVERTAAAIAAGKLDSRVPARDPRTEVGQLSLALNGMLTQIQQAMASSESSADAARTSEDRLRRFITDVSHELRTPLTTIRGFAELYRQGAARDVDMLMSRIESEASRMSLFVDDLLLLARLDAERPLEHDQVDLLALAADAVHDIRAVEPQRPVLLDVFAGPGIPMVLGDEARLRQVLANLVANALKHTAEDTTITIRVGTVGDDAVIEVCDDGPGMNAQDAERVFERFYRADSSRNRSSGGTGLGLSIVDSLVHAHGGTVGLTTSPGQGCRFRVALPRVIDDGGPSEDQSDVIP